MVRNLLILLLFCFSLSAGAQFNRQSLIVKGALTGVVPRVLDGIAFGQAEYSLRQARTNYTGNVVLVRRSSDNATQNIGFTATGDFDATAFNAFIGAGQGYAVTIYDQSGNSNDATQSTTSLQWQIVQLAEANNRYVFYSPTGGYYTTTNSLILNLQKGDGTVTVYCKLGLVADPNAAYGLVGTNGAATGNHGYDLYWDDRASVPRNNAILSETTKGIGGQFVNQDINLNAVTPNVFHALGNTVNLTSSTAANRSRLYVDGIQLTQTNTKTATASTNTTSTFPLQIGAVGNGVFPFVGYVAEIFIQNTIHTGTTVAGIRANQDTYY